MCIEKHKKFHLIKMTERAAKPQKCGSLQFCLTLRPFISSGSTEMNENFTYAERLQFWLQEYNSKNHEIKGHQLQRPSKVVFLLYLTSFASFFWLAPLSGKARQSVYMEYQYNSFMICSKTYVICVNLNKLYHLRI